MIRNLFLMVAALVLLFLSAFKLEAQVGFSELDPNILWVADSTIGRIDGFAVHPNGNVFAYFKSKIYEIDGSNGNLIRELPKFSESLKYESIAVSKNGRYLATCYDEVTMVDLQNNYSHLIIGNGNKVEFTHDSKKIAYVNSTQIQSLHDSIVVILDIETGIRTFLKTEEMITKIAFSPDGRFLATGGSGQDVFGKSYTSLKLWDANTLKLIKELEKMENTNFNFYRIEFSNNNKLVAYLPYNGEVSIFSTESSNLYRKFGVGNQPIQGIGKFCFLNDSLITFSSIEPSTLIWNYVKDERAYNIANFNSTRGIEYSIELDAIILGTTSKLYAYSLNSIMTSVQEDANQTTINAIYSKGTLTVKDIHSIGNQVNIEIFDINGKLIRKFDIQPNGSELKVPLILQKGTYLLNINEGQNHYTTKFLVTE